MKQFYSLVIGIIVCVMISGFYYVYAPFSVVEKGGSYIAYPFIRFQQLIIDRIKVFLLNRHTIHEFQLLNNQISQERDQLLADNIQLRAAAHYMQDTQELRDFNKRFGNSAIIAQIMVRHFSQDGHYFFLDAGSNKGVATDMVIVHNNCLLGKVTDVYPWYCKARLITDRSCKIASYCNMSSISGIHEGCNDEMTTHLSFVSHLAPIQKDDLILSSGEGMIFPRGFALGRIVSYNRDGLFYKIHVQPLIDLKTLIYCAIIPKGLSI